MRKLPLLSAISLALTLTGCATPRSGPNTSAMLDYDPAGAIYDLVELTPENIAQFVGAEPQIANKGRTPATSALTLEPNDVLKVTIYERSDGGLFAPMTAGGSVFGSVRVDEAGAITLPYAGRIRAAGVRLTRLPDLVRAALAGKAVDPEVHVELVSSPTHSVLVTGEVKTPGLVTTLDGPLSVAEAIARAGGPTLPAQTIRVTTRRDGTVRRASYLALLDEPATYVGRGDEIIVESSKLQFVAMGAVKTPGLQEMARPNMTLLQGLAQAGGLNDNSANPGGVFLFRLRAEPKPRPLVVHVDFKRPESIILANRFALLPDDTVYVTNAPVYEFQKLIAPLVQALIIGRSSASLSN